MRYSVKTLIMVGLLLGLNFNCMSVFADSPNIVYASHDASQVNQMTQARSDLRNRASQWGLSISEYQHYEWLMNNTPSGKWYKQMNPAEVLALNAPDETSMMKYAKIVAQNTHVRVTRELLFNKLYRQAYQRLYPNEKPIELASNHGVLNLDGALKPGDHVWLFTDLHDETNNLVLQSLLNTIEHSPKTTLDIYFVGKSLDKHAIEAWAQQNAIPKSLADRSVTLNYGNDRFKAVTHGKSVALPYVGLVRGHQFQPVSLSSLVS